MAENRLDNSKIQLLGMSVNQIAELLVDCPKYTASQIYGFLMDGKDFFEMTSLKKSLRDSLQEQFIANPVQILDVFKGKSGTKKYLYKLCDNNLIEGVFMPHDYGNTLCVSTQVGCRMGCTFCASGIDGLVRNLTVGEILGQVIATNRDNGGSAKNRNITNIVLMGSGEPLDNYDNTIAFLDAVSAPNGINISERNISLSTSGLCNRIVDFANSGHKVTLSISLHAPFDELRSKLMPINRAYSIDKLINSAKYYFEKTGRRVIFEYTLIKDENDSQECANKLASLTRGFSSHVNLIRLNEVKERNYNALSVDATEAFLHKLEALGVSATIRKSLGNDIEGACGQLRRRYLEEKDMADTKS